MSLLVSPPAHAPAGDGWIWAYATTFTDASIAGKGLHGNFTMLPTDMVAALPTRLALGRALDVVNPLNNLSASPTAWDVGPWNTDDPYFLEAPCVPRAVKQYLAYTEGNGEYAKDFKGRLVVSPAGIDLTPAVWQHLGVPADVAYKGNHSGWVWWRFKDE
jgi:hypothetical protein